jgi:ABC-2 type transport system permease protein
MLKILNIARKDLLQIVREKQSFLFLLVMPILFTILLGFAFGGFSSQDEDTRLPVALVDQDGEYFSQTYRQILETSDVIRLMESPDQLNQLKQLVREEELAAAGIIPPSYSRALLEGVPLPLQVVVDEASISGQAARSEFQSAALQLSSMVQTARTSVSFYEDQRAFKNESARQAYFDQAFTMAGQEWQTPPVTMKTATLLDDETSRLDNNIFSHTSPGMAAQFAIAGLMGAAGILVIERKTGAMQRLLTTSTSRFEILMGHFLAMFVTIFLQLLILILFGQLFLKLDYFGSPSAALAMITITALFTASLGLLIGSAAKNDDQVTIFSLLSMFVLAGLGGAWVPLEFTPRAFQRIAYLTPVAWVMEGFKDITIRGFGLAGISTSLLVLTAYAGIFFIAAIWRFQSE